MRSISQRTLLWIGLLMGLFLLTTSGCNGKNDLRQPQSVTLEELFSHPQRYGGKEICTHGVYLQAFEVSALAQTTYEKDGITHISQPNIWIEGGDFRQKEGCFSDEQWPESLFCQVEVCGKFQIANAARHWKTAIVANWVEGGFGHMSAWPYQINALQQASHEPTLPPPLTVEPVITIFP